MNYEDSAIGWHCPGAAPSERTASTFAASASLVAEGPSNQTVPLVSDQSTPRPISAPKLPDSVRLLLPIPIEVEGQQEILQLLECAVKTCLHAPNYTPILRRFTHSLRRERQVGSLSRGGRNRKGWFRIGATNMEILNRRLELTGYGKFLV